MTKDTARPDGPGSREPSPAVSAASGFDPSRWRASDYDGKPRHLPKAEGQELNKLLSAARDHIATLTPYRRSVLAKAARSVSPVNCGWQQYKIADIFVFELHSDSDQSPKGGDSEAAPSPDESAGRQSSPCPTPSTERVEL